MKTTFAGINRACVRILSSYFILKTTALKIFIKTLICNNGSFVLVFCFFWLSLGHDSQIPLLRFL